MVCCADKIVSTRNTSPWLLITLIFFPCSSAPTWNVILLAAGGHGFEMLEDAEIIEVKQGPYSSTEDKVRFENTAQAATPQIMI